MLAQHHDGQRHIFQQSFVLGGKHGGDQDQAVYGVMAQHLHGLHFPGGIVGGVHQQQPVAPFLQHAANALYHAGTAVAGQLGQDDPDLPGTFGPQHLCLQAGAVTGGFLCGSDLSALFLAQIAAVEITAHGRLGYPGDPGKLGNIHSWASFSYADAPFF